MRLLDYMNGNNVRTRKFVLAMTCTSCLFSVDATIAAEAQPPQFNYDAFVSSLQAQMARIPQPRPMAPVNSSGVPIGGPSPLTPTLINATIPFPTYPALPQRAFAPVRLYNIGGSVGGGPAAPVVSSAAPAP